MSRMYCPTHDHHFDGDKTVECPECDARPVCEACDKPHDDVSLVRMTNGMEAYACPQCRGEEAR